MSKNYKHSVLRENDGNVIERALWMLETCSYFDAAVFFLEVVF
jgi:hypothetical protein